MKKLERKENQQKREVTVIQFGEGNFLRAFVDWMLDVSNEQE